MTTPKIMHHARANPCSAAFLREPSKPGIKRKHMHTNTVILAEARIQ